MRVLFLGDVAWSVGRRALACALPELRREWGGFDFVVVNCENAAAGKGMTEKIFKEFLDLGVDGMTSGNHIWDKNDFGVVLGSDARIFRPANYPAVCPGQGCGVLERNGRRLGILNLEGQVFMPPIDSPFYAADACLEELRAQGGAELPILVDFHAEATSEKEAMGFYLDGRVSAVLGTHTHVQTADERILPGGTAYLSDVGMTGGHGGILGVKKESAMPRFLTGMPARFEMCTELPAVNGAVVEIDESTGRARSIVRVQKAVELP